MSGTNVLIRPHLDANGKDLAVEHWQDCEDIIERNKMLRTMEQKSDWGWHVATIPNGVMVKWMIEEGVPVLGLPAEEFQKFLRKKLSDPDWRHLRTDK